MYLGRTFTKLLWSHKDDERWFDQKSNCDLRSMMKHLLVLHSFRCQHRRLLPSSREWILNPSITKPSKKVVFSVHISESWESLSLSATMSLRSFQLLSKGGGLFAKYSSSTCYVAGKNQMQSPPLLSSNLSIITRTFASKKVRNQLQSFHEHGCRLV